MNNALIIPIIIFASICLWIVLDFTIKKITFFLDRITIKKKIKWENRFDYIMNNSRRKIYVDENSNVLLQTFTFICYSKNGKKTFHERILKKGLKKNENKLLQPAPINSND